MRRHHKLKRLEAQSTRTTSHSQATHTYTQHTQVIRNGQMLGIHERRNRSTLSTGSLAVAEANAVKEARRGAKAAAAAAAAEGLAPGIEVIGEVQLVNFYNDGGRGTGTAQVRALAVPVLSCVCVCHTALPRDGCSRKVSSLNDQIGTRASPDVSCLLASYDGAAKYQGGMAFDAAINPQTPVLTLKTPQEMALPERAALAFEGVVVAAVDVLHAAPLYQLTHPSFTHIPTGNGAARARRTRV